MLKVGYVTLELYCLEGCDLVAVVIIVALAYVKYVFYKLPLATTQFAV